MNYPIESIERKVKIQDVILRASVKRFIDGGQTGSFGSPTEVHLRLWASRRLNRRCRATGVRNESLTIQDLVSSGGVVSNGPLRMVSGSLFLLIRPSYT
jgi:hypothetical protein